MAGRAWDALADELVHGAVEAFVADLTWRLAEMLSEGVSNPDRYAVYARTARQAAMGVWAEHSGRVSAEARRAFALALAEECEGIVAALSEAHPDRAAEVGEDGLTPWARVRVEQAAEDMSAMMERQCVAVATTAADAWHSCAADAAVRIGLGAGREETVALETAGLAGELLTTVDYASGRRTSIEAAVRRHVVTEQNRARNEVMRKECESWGHDLVFVSSHYGCRPTHEWFQGQVFSLSGASGETVDASGRRVRYRPLSDTGYLTAAGLCGINCRHRIFPFSEGNTQLPPTEFPELEKHYGMDSAEFYANRQKMNALQREVRAAKREAETLLAEGADATEARYALGRAQKRAREFAAATGTPRDLRLEKPYAVVANVGGKRRGVVVGRQVRALTAKQAGMSAKRRSSVFTESFGSVLDAPKAAYLASKDPQRTLRERTGVPFVEIDDWVARLPDAKRASVLAAAEHAIAFVGAPARGLRLIRGDALGDGVYAQNERRESGKYLVRISRKEARLLSPEELEQVVFHEIAHSAENALTDDRTYEAERRALVRFQEGKSPSLRKSQLSGIIETELQAIGLDAWYEERKGMTVLTGDALAEASAISSYAVRDADKGAQDSELAAECIRFVANHGYGKNRVADAVTRRLVDGQGPQGQGAQPRD